MFQRALVCTNFEDGIHRLVHFVPSLADSGFRQITFVHAVPLLEDREIPRINQTRLEEAQERLSAALSDVPEGIEVHIEIQSGKPSEHILRAVKKYHSDIIILGTPSRSRLTEQLFGSTTQELCKHLQIPVMVLRPQLVSTYTAEELRLRCQHLVRYLLIPYDDSRPAKYLIDAIKGYVTSSPVHALKQCLLCWVVEEGGRRRLRSAIDYLDYQVQEAEEKIAAAKAKLEELDVTTNTIVLKGNALSAILDMAVKEDISAIAISSDSMGKLLEWSVPSFAGEIMRQSWHPVIYFPPTR